MTVFHLGSDPLSRRPWSWTQRLLEWVSLVFGSILAHAIIIGAFALAGFALVGPQSDSATIHEAVRVTMVETPPPPPADVTEEKETRAAPVVKKRPNPVKKKRPPPPPDPIDVPPDAPAPTKPVAQPRRIVGLSLSSTVTGGGGPGFAVGNTRMGQTEHKAANPTEVKKLAPQRSNRQASRIPTSGVQFSPPRKLQSARPVFPPVLKARGIEGDVVLAVTVSKEGHVVAVKIVKASQYDLFNRNAVAAAEKERYEPARRGGQAIEFVVKYTVRFRLTDY